MSLWVKGGCYCKKTYNFLFPLKMTDLHYWMDLSTMLSCILQKKKNYAIMYIIIDLLPTTNDIVYIVFTLCYESESMLSWNLLGTNYKVSWSQFFCFILMFTVQSSTSWVLQNMGLCWNRTNPNFLFLIKRGGTREWYNLFQMSFLCH